MLIPGFGVLRLGLGSSGHARQKPLLLLQAIMSAARIGGVWALVKFKILSGMASEPMEKSALLPSSAKSAGACNETLQAQLLVYWIAVPGSQYIFCMAFYQNRNPAM